MSTNREQTLPSSSRDRGAIKSTQTEAANIASLKPTRQEATPPSRANIATKAYEIWLASGQETGKAQQHWFEAEQQLRRA